MRAPETVEDMLKHYDEWGGPSTYPHYPAGWAVAMDTPFTYTKQVASDFGGTRNGMVIHWPKGIKAKGEVRSQFGHVVDIAPTIYEAAKIPAPKNGERHRSGPTRRQEPGVFVRQRRCKGNAHRSILRDVRQPRDL